MTITIMTGDVRERLAELPDESVHCVVTSPPYWGLRDYGVAGQIGLEPTPVEYVETMVAVFREVRRVLRGDGTLWLNLGDSYASGEIGRHDALGAVSGNAGITYKGLGEAQAGKRQQRKMLTGLKPKDLVGIPWRVAFALQADGWWLRQDIIWSKPNPMPESVTDRCTKAHEYLFLLSKSERYYFDAAAIAEPVAASSIARWAQDIDQQQGSDRVPGKTNGTMKAVGRKNVAPGKMMAAEPTKGESTFGFGETRNKRSVWEVTTQPFSEAHFATFPPALIEPCILAGTSEKGCCAKCGAPWGRQTERTPATVMSPASDYGNGAGRNDGNRSQLVGASSRTLGWVPTCSCGAHAVPCTILDPFGGAGTTGLVADRLGRDAILVELNPEYAAMAERRVRADAPMFVKILTNPAHPTHSAADPQAVSTTSPDQRAAFVMRGSAVRSRPAAPNHPIENAE